MPRCSRCGRTWQTLPGEEQDHDCPKCGPICPPTDKEVDVAREKAAFPCEDGHYHQIEPGEPGYNPNKRQWL